MATNFSLLFLFHLRTGIVKFNKNREGLCSFTKEKQLNKILLVLLLGFVAYMSLGCEPVCLGECNGDGGSCLTCPDPTTFCSRTGGSNCSAVYKGVYCCRGGVSGGGGGVSCDTGCYGNTPWRCGGYCYSEPPSGNHACVRC